LSATKYCSASLMLERGGVAITHAFDIVEAAGPVDADAPASA
jgi:putative redox protein